MAKEPFMIAAMHMYKVTAKAGVKITKLDQADLTKTGEKKLPHGTQFQLLTPNMDKHSKLGGGYFGKHGEIVFFISYDEIDPKYLEYVGNPSYKKPGRKSGTHRRGKRK